jgi:hypothetical protein
MKDLLSEAENRLAKPLVDIAIDRLEGLVGMGMPEAELYLTQPIGIINRASELLISAGFTSRVDNDCLLIIGVTL